MTSLHLSGEWNRPDAEVRRATLALVKAHSPAYVTHTEARLHAEALRGFAGYGLIHFGAARGGQTECAFQYRLDGPPLLGARPANLSRLPIPRRDGDLCFAAHGEFEDHHLIVLHLPSGVEGLTGIRRNEQGRVWRDCIAGLQRLIATIDGPIVITGDWNVNLRRRWVRRLLRRAFPGFTFRVPPRGTRGRFRAIDFSIVRGSTVTDSDVLNNPASDHEALLERMKETVVMPQTISRAQWGARVARGGPGQLSPSRVEGIALHWPAMTKPLRGVAAVSAALRNWQAFHMDTNGWSDIGYQEAYDQDGNRYILRGMLTQSGANGNEDVNERFGAYLLVIAPGEQPSAAMMAAVRAGIARHRAAFPNSRRIVGHGQIRPGGSECPGRIVQGLINDGKFSPAAAPRPPAPQAPTPSRVTRVKAALLAVLNGPDARGIPTQRRFVRGLLATIRATVNRLPER